VHRRRRLPAAALGYLGVAAAALLLALPDSRSPWWIYADPDGAYVGSSLNILIGNHTSYLDHPGLPTQDALALGFGAWHIVDRARGDAADPTPFVDRRMLDVDGSRWLYRGWAILTYALGAVLVAILMGRLFRHWTWGVAGGVLFLAAPGVAEIAHRLRPDAMLSALSVAIAYLVVTGFERRSASRYLAAAAVFGLAMTVKISVLWAALPIAVAVVWRPPEPGWHRRLAASLRSLSRRAWLATIACSVAWLAVCLRVNRDRLPVLTNDDQRAVVLDGAALLAGLVVATVISQRFRIPWAERIFSPLTLALVLAFGLGVLLPASLILDDGIQAVVAAAESISGGRVNEHVDAFADFRLDAFFRFPLFAATIVFALSGAAVVVGWRRRVYWPLVLATAVVPLVIVAAARFSYDYYYAPAYAFALPGALWLLARGSPRVGLRQALVVALVAYPLLGDLGTEETGQIPTGVAAAGLADEILRPGEVILAPLDIPIEDTRWGIFMDGFSDHAPAYPARFVLDGTWQSAVQAGLTPAFVVGKAGELPPVGTTAETTIAGYGPFVVRRLPLDWGPGDAYGVARILRLPETS
jgi:hypothetical protein